MKMQDKCHLPADYLIKSSSDSIAIFQQSVSGKKTQPDASSASLLIRAAERIPLHVQQFILASLKKGDVLEALNAIAYSSYYVGIEHGRRATWGSEKKKIQAPGQAKKWQDIMVVGHFLGWPRMEVWGHLKKAGMSRSEWKKQWEEYFPRQRKTKVSRKAQGVDRQVL